MCEHPRSSRTSASPRSGLTDGLVTFSPDAQTGMFVVQGLPERASGAGIANLVPGPPLHERGGDDLQRQLLSRVVERELPFPCPRRFGTDASGANLVL